MESWVPLFEIFQNSPTPESEATIWLQQSFNASSSTTNPITTCSFLSLLTKPYNPILIHTSPISTSHSHPNLIMWIETLPSFVQARIISFLTVERTRFCAQHLCKLARGMLSKNHEPDFWVEKAARNLLDVMSAPNYNWISCLDLDSPEEGVHEDFYSLPDWLKEIASTSESLLPWLPISPGDLNSRSFFGTLDNDLDHLVGTKDNADEIMCGVESDIQIGSPRNRPLELDPGIQELAFSLRERILLPFESNLKSAGLANRIRESCLSHSGDPMSFLSVIEPWKSDDETCSSMISHLSNENDNVGHVWSSRILGSFILPKLLLLETTASRVLVTSTIEYCKVHQKSAVNGLLFPLIHRLQGINNPICDVISRIVRECLHRGHVSAFCQSILCDEESKGANKIVCLPCHKCLISKEL